MEWSAEWVPVLPLCPLMAVRLFLSVSCSFSSPSITLLPWLITITTSSPAPGWRRRHPLVPSASITHNADGPR
ncbi:hypothetical protein B0H19DRAFT_1141988 [Mycena capillaripes]|nr:hypothetical protein B0H19DRAFT_1141988 [Mycena capillaripes]